MELPQAVLMPPRVPLSSELDSAAADPSTSHTDSGGSLASRCQGPVAVVILTLSISAACSSLLSPSLIRSNRAAFPEVGAALLVFQWLTSISALIFLALTNMSDPGLCRRENAPAELELCSEAGESLAPPAERGRGVLRKAADGTPYRWCNTCLLWKPPRASHCSICERCFERFDHHCPWVGTCVARSNHRWFAGFLTSIGIAGLTVPAILLLSFAQSGAFASAPEEWEGGVFVLGTIALFALCCFGGLSCGGVTTLWMLSCDVTTKELHMGERGQGGGNGCSEVRCAPCTPRQHQRIRLCGDSVTC